MKKVIIVSIGLLELTPDLALAAGGREVPGLTRTAFAQACERSGGTVSEGSAGAANALVCTLPNGREIVCGFAIQPPMCVWRPNLPPRFRDLFGGSQTMRGRRDNEGNKSESGSQGVGNVAP